MPEVVRSVVIESSPDHVWTAIRDFHDVSWASGVLETCQPVGDLSGDQVGAVRILNGIFRERLLALDDLEHVIKYQIEDGPSPISSREVRRFVATIRIRPVTESGQAFVEYAGRWEAQDDAALDFAGGIYTALLAALKKSCA